MNPESQMKFRRALDGLFLISTEAVRSLELYRQLKANSPEAGGILLGRIFVEDRTVVTDTVTTPSPQDRASRLRFFRAQKPAQLQVDAAWKASGGTQNYLGEWHTHPENHPRPSSVDVTNWLRIMRDSTFEQGSLFFVIVGREAIRVWEVTREVGEPILLHRICE